MRSGAGRLNHSAEGRRYDSNLLDSMPSVQRDRRAARRFLRQVLDIAGRRPPRITTYQHPAYRKAIRWIVGRKVLHRTDRYLNNRTEQDHRGIKQRYQVMLGFGSFASASRFFAAFEALRQYLRARRKCGEAVPLAVERQQFAERWEALVAELAAA